MVFDEPYAEREREQRDCRDDEYDDLLGLCTQRDQQQRKEQIELLLYRERPGVKQRLCVCRSIEIASLFPKADVRNEEDCPDDRLGKAFEVIRKEQDTRGYKGRDKQREEGWQNAPGPPL